MSDKVKQNLRYLFFQFKGSFLIDLASTPGSEIQLKDSLFAI